MLSRRETRRILVRVTLIGIVVLLGLVAIGLLVATILLAFLTVASPAMATFLTVLCLAAVGLLLALFLSSSRDRQGSLLSGGLDSAVSGLLRTIKRKPMGAVGTALALGIMTELMQRGGSSSDDRRSRS